MFVIFVLTFQIERIVLAIVYSQRDLPDGDIFKHLNLECFYIAIRFDVLASSYFLILPLILTFVYAFYQKNWMLSFKKYYYQFVLVLISIVCVVNFFFFDEYHSQFNYMIFGIINDQPLSIMAVALKNYPLGKVGICLLLFLCIVYFFVKKLFTGNFIITEGISKKISFILLSVLLLVCGLRGGQLWGKVISNEHIGVSDSAFVSSILSNPFYLIKLEIFRLVHPNYLKEYKAKEKDLYAYSSEIFNSKERDLDKILSKMTLGSSFEKPERVFFLIVESHSSWALDRAYTNGNQLVPNTKNLLQKYSSCANTISAAQSTRETMSCLLLGFPQVVSSNNKLSANMARNFMPGEYLKELGWDNYFYYAGKSSWNYLGDLVEFCGFKMIGGELIGKNYGTKQWGMTDGDLLNFVIDKNIEPKTFNIILTVSNHEPYDVDLEKEGLHREFIDDRRIWHHWYADKYVGIFVEKILKKYPKTLIVVSGDHPSRLYYKNAKINARSQSCIPTIFISNMNISFEEREIKVASHLDIFPTIFDLIAPKNFKYCSWGESLLIASNNRLVFNDKYAYLNGTFYDIISTDFPDSERERIRKIKALAVWRMFNGNSGLLPSE